METYCKFTKYWQQSGTNSCIPETGSNQVLPRSEPVISGFWSRIIAFIMDGIILWLIGTMLGLLLFDFLARLGDMGGLVGFAIAALYFGIFNSSLGRGQTIGKRIMKIAVADQYGKTISLGRSLTRFLPLGLIILTKSMLPGLTGHRRVKWIIRKYGFS